MGVCGGEVVLSSRKMLEHYTAMVQNSLSAVSEVALGQNLSAGPPVTFRQAANNNVGGKCLICVRGVVIRDTAARRSWRFCGFWWPVENELN